MSQSFRRSSLWLTIALGILSAFAPLTTDMYLPAMPSMVNDFATDPSSVQMTLSIFFIGLAFGQAIYGPLSDRIGRRAPLIFGCVLYTIASLLCALAPSIESLIVLRLAQALGGCAGMVIGRSIVRDLVGGRDATRMYSFLMLVSGLAPICAPILGGQVLVWGGWRTIFWILAGFGVICSLISIFGLDESLPKERRLTSGLKQVFVDYGKLLSDKSFLGYALAGGFASAGMFAYISASSFVFIDLYGLSPQQFSLVFGGNALGLVLMSQSTRWLINRYTNQQQLKGILAIYFGASLLLTIFAITGIGGLYTILPCLFCTIAMVGGINPNATAAAMEPQAKFAGSASALLGTLQFAAGGIAGALVSMLDNGTAVPMAAMICVCGLIANLSLRFLALRAQAA
jgi:DHA1 family bicyclomycin/chloramphenicol resistance-like MFS transporter